MKLDNIGDTTGEGDSTEKTTGEGKYVGLAPPL